MWSWGKSHLSSDRLASENCIFKDFLVLTFGKPPAHGSSPFFVLLAPVHGAQPGRVLLTRTPAVATLPSCICWTAGSSVLRLLSQPLMPVRPLCCLCCCPLMASATSQLRQVSPPHSVLSFFPSSYKVKQQRSQGSQKEISHTPSLWVQFQV